MAYTVNDLIDLLRRNTDVAGWLQPILDDPNSAAALAGLLDPLARASLAGDRTAATGSVSESPGGSPGTAVLTLTRASSGTAGTFPRGYLFVDGRGVRAVAATVVPVPSGSLSVQVPVITLRQSEVVNSEEDTSWQLHAENAVLMDTTATTVLAAPPGTAGLVATSFSTVTSADPVQGGTSDWLSVLGAERGVKRQPNEPTGDFRLRVRSIPDAVSPLAVADAVQAAASRVGVTGAIVREPFGDGATPALKADHGLGEFSGVYLTGFLKPGSRDVSPNSPKTDFCDDAGQGHTVLGIREARAYFRVEVPLPRNPDGLGLFYDDGFLDDPSLGFSDTAPHPGVVSALMQIWEEADRKRAAGVQFDVEVEV